MIKRFVVGGDLQQRGRRRVEVSTHQRGVIGVHVSFGGKGDFRRFEIRALDQANGRAFGGERLHVGFGAVEVRLNHRAEVVETGIAQRPVNAQRRIDVGAALHVDGHGDVMLLRVAEDRADVVHAERLVDVQAEVGQLERDARLQPILRDARQQLAISGDDRFSIGGAGDAFAQVVERDQQP